MKYVKYSWRAVTEKAPITVFSLLHDSEWNMWNYPQRDWKDPFIASLSAVKVGLIRQGHNLTRFDIIAESRTCHLACHCFLIWTIGNNQTEIIDKLLLHSLLKHLIKLPNRSVWQQVGKGKCDLLGLHLFGRSAVNRSDAIWKDWKAKSMTWFERHLLRQVTLPLRFQQDCSFSSWAGSSNWCSYATKECQCYSTFIPFCTTMICYL